MTSHKCCFVCKTSFPATSEYFPVRKDSKDGLRNTCKKCTAIYAVKYCEAHKIEKAKKDKERYEKNTEFYNEKSRKYNLEHAEEIKKYHKDYYHVNKEHITRKNKEYSLRNAEKIRIRTNDWRRRNTHRRIPEMQRRNARIRNLPAAFTNQDWECALNYFHYCCAVCGNQLNGLFHTPAADHWIPLSNPECPGTIPTNIVPLCHGTGGCNNKKWNKDPNDWVISTFGKRRGRNILKKIDEYFQWVRSKKI